LFTVCALPLCSHRVCGSLEILSQGAAQVDLTPEEYLESMALDGTWGGGPEIVALANHLSRPIHVYELAAIDKACPLSVGTGKGAASWGVRRMCAFGSPKFDNCREGVIHILSANSKFPDLKVVKDPGQGNHFLCLTPCDVTRDSA